MSITRRGFIQSAIASMGAMVLDPERLLWVPGAKTIFIPQQTGKVDICTQEDLDSILALNRVAFGVVYTNPQDVLRESKRTGIDPFSLYRGWERRSIQ